MLGRRLTSNLVDRLSVDRIGVHLTLGRAVLALGTLVTLLANSDEVLFHDPGSANPEPNCGPVARYGLFCITSGTPGLGRLLGAALCATVILGLAPLATSLAYWYLASSLFFNATPVDGGDQLTVALSFLVLIVSIGDTRRCGWLPRRHRRRSALSAFLNVVWILIPLQVAFVYLNSAIAKLSAPIWVEGSALWYWVQHPGFNARPREVTIGLDLLAQPLVTATVSWGVIALEIAIAAVILLGGRHRSVRLITLVVGITFHFVIACLIGLVSFGLAMSGALILALWRPRDAIPWWLMRRLCRAPKDRKLRQELVDV